jgi:nucleotide-binding universal stress UspA family protein
VWGALVFFVARSDGRWQHGSMIAIKKRQSFEAGHARKFLLIVDDSQEVESALYYAASRIAHSSGSLMMLHVIEPQEHQPWAGVRQVQIEEETAKAKALFRMFRRKLHLAGFDHVACEDVIREGVISEQILQVIAEDEDVAILVLGASIDAKGPGPLVAALASGKAGGFPIPVTVVPGNLALADIIALA